MLATEEGELESLAVRKPKARRPEELTEFDDLVELATRLTEQMRQAAEELQFEIAASLRDEIAELKREMRTLEAAGMGSTKMKLKAQE
jgi:excinuclease ABC subunit B